MKVITKKQMSKELESLIEKASRKAEESELYDPNIDKHPVILSDREKLKIELIIEDEDFSKRNREQIQQFEEDVVECLNNHGIEYDECYESDPTHYYRHFIDELELSFDDLLKLSEEVIEDCEYNIITLIVLMQIVEEYYHLHP
jgi:hypothetical protein